MKADEAGRFCFEIMSRGVSLPDIDSQRKIQELRKKMFSALTNDEIQIYDSFYNKATSGQFLTKEETAYVNLLITKGFHSLPESEQERFKVLADEALNEALVIHSRP